MSKTDLTNPLVAQAEHVLRQVYLPRIISCLEQLSAEQIWWRPNEASNSVGNLVLHLTGNVRQWIISGLGGTPDVRQRDLEFSERGPLPRRVLVSRLRKTVEEACGVLGKLSPEDLARVHTIQKYHVTGTEAAFHVAEHFSHHAGQIILLTKMVTGRDLKFTQLPGEKRRKSRNLPTL
ncbi:MAG TPA: DinB family protein [Terriglobia bacterium]|nr:DinB family protein [Terriglobia bacterium]